MRLFYCSTDAGSFDFLVTTDEARAVQLFSIHMVLAKTPATRLGIKEITPDMVAGKHQEGLQKAISEGIEAFVAYEVGKGWVLHPINARFDELADATGQERVQ